MEETTPQPRLDARPVSRPPVPVTIGFVQMNTTLDETVYLPYSVGMLQAYLQRHTARPGGYAFTIPVVEPVAPEAALERIGSADIVGFSNYVWNGNRSLAVARALKEERPETLVVFGGPHVPDHAEAFLRAHPYVDVACHGEGEAVFNDIAERYPERRWEDVPGVSYLEEGRFVNVPRRERIKDLSEVPSPFLDGVFEPLMATRPGRLWRTAWETNRGCPFRCTFCDWGSAIAAKVNRFDIDRILAEAEWMGERQIAYIFVADANFGILTRDVEIARVLASVRKRYGYPGKVLIQNTKNQTERAYATLKILTDAQMAAEINISIQSTTPEVLAAIKRENISLETYAEVQRRFVRDGIPTYVDLIVGLPAETVSSFKQSISRVLEGGQHHRVQFHNLSILPNAEMGDSAYQAEYGLRTVTTNVVNNHAPPEAVRDGIVETQEIVIETAAMPREDWRHARTFAWLTSLYHLDHTLLLPILVTWKLTGLPLWQVIDVLIAADETRFPVLGEQRAFCLDFAERLQRGEGEYVLSSDWLGSHWTVDEFLFIKLCLDGRLDELHREAEEILAALLPADDVDARTKLADAIQLNRGRLREPLADGVVGVECRYDVHAFCQAMLAGHDAEWRRGPVAYEVEHRSYGSLDAWLRDLVRDRVEDKLASVRSTSKAVPQEV